MSFTKPAIVIIPGAFGSPESYAKLSSALESHGYEVHVVDLVTNNEARPPNGGLKEDSTLVRSCVERLVEAERTVAAIGHSYGGQVMSNALHGLGLEARSSKGLEGGVCALIYMAAFALPEGLSTFDKLKEFGKKEDDAATIFDVAEDHTIVLRDPVAFLDLSGPKLGEEEIEAYKKNLRRWNGTAMFQPLEKAAWRDIPIAYIHTTKDTPVAFEAQRSMVSTLENEGRKVHTYIIETGHSPHVTATEKVVEAVIKVVSPEVST